MKVGQVVTELFRADGQTHRLIWRS